MVFTIGKRRIEFLSFDNDDEILSKCIALYWASSIANSVLKRILGGSSSATLISALICMPAFFVFAMLAMIVLVRHNRVADFVLPSGLLMTAFFVSYLRGIPLEPMMDLIIWSLLSMFLGSVIVSLSDYRILYFELKRSIPLYLVLAIPSVFASRASSEYMMHFSYMLVLPVLLSFYCFFEERQRAYVIPLMGFVALILLFGSRGAIGCIASFVLLYAIFKSKKQSVKITLIAFIALGVSFYQRLLTIVCNVLERYGISSRTFYLLANDPLHDSGRKILYSQAQRLIEMKPLTGWGLAGERLYMDTYPHNITYEFLIDYGKPFGYLMLVIVGVVLLIGLFKSKGKQALFYTIFLSGSISLFWSGSYLSSTSFWIALYMAVFSIEWRSKDHLAPGSFKLLYKEKTKPLSLRR